MIDVTWLFLIVVYAILSVVNLYAVYLYCIACTKMQKTRMIRSVYYLLLALLLENVYFMFTALFEGFKYPLANVFKYPLLWSVPKLILLLALTYFIVASLSPPDKTIGNRLTIAHKTIHGGR